MSCSKADDPFEQSLGLVLRAGVIASALVVLAGGVIYLWRHGAEPADHRTFRGEPAELRQPAGILRVTLHGRGRGIIAFGLLVLISTPIARVAFSAAAFAQQRDWTYVALTMFVLAMLLLGLLSGCDAPRTSSIGSPAVQPRPPASSERFSARSSLLPIHL